MLNQIASQKTPPPKPWPLPNFNLFHIDDFDLIDSIGRFLSITDGRKSALQGIACFYKQYSGRRSYEATVDGLV